MPRASRPDYQKRQIAPRRTTLFNHAQYNGLDTTIQFNAAGVQTRASSGQVTSARDPRIIQLALRLMF